MREQFNTSSEMTLDEAIEHAQEIADSRCDTCGQEHRQLAEWLRELKQYREYFKSFETLNGNLFGIDLNKVPESCHGCPQHPSNGGSGICFCILGQPLIT